MLRRTQQIPRLIRTESYVFLTRVYFLCLISTLNFLYLNEKTKLLGDMKNTI